MVGDGVGASVADVWAHAVLVAIPVTKAISKVALKLGKSFRPGGECPLHLVPQSSIIALAFSSPHALHRGGLP